MLMNTAQVNWALGPFLFSFCITHKCLLHKGILRIVYGYRIEALIFWYSQQFVFLSITPCRHRKNLRRFLSCRPQVSRPVDVTVWSSNIARPLPLSIIIVCHAPINSPLQLIIRSLFHLPSHAKIAASKRQTRPYAFP